MNRSIASLLLVLVIQCVLVATVYWPSILATETPTADMVTFAVTDISEIQVGDEFDNDTVLMKIGERWTLPEMEHLPADSAMVEKLLAALTNNATGWPIASSIAARQRFQVASYHYQRRVRLLRENEVQGTFFLGTSPGYRKVHARNELQDAIYSIGFNLHDAPGNSGAWLDHKLLQIRTPVSITADSYSLQRDGSDWLSGIGLAPNPRELEALLSSLRSLQIDGVADEDSQRDLADSEADLVLTVDSLAGKVTLELFQLDERYFIHSNQYPLFFTISAFDYDRLVGIDFRLISGEQQ